jgi:hypothetical protein
VSPRKAEPDLLDTFRAAVRSGIWSVTKNDRFYGDYLTRTNAVWAACDAARRIEAGGGSAQVLADPAQSVIPHSAPGPRP